MMKPQFNGQQRQENPVILAEMEMELRTKHLIGYTTERIEVVAPDPAPKLIIHFLETTGYRHQGEWITDERRLPMTWPQILENSPDIAQEMIDTAEAAGGPAGLPTAPTHFYGNTAAIRRIAHADYTSDQKSLRAPYKEHKEQITSFFETVGSFCTPVGRDVLRPFLPSAVSSGDPFGAMIAMREAMGIGAPTNVTAILQQAQTLKIGKEENLPTYFAAMDAIRRTLVSLQHPISEASHKAMITKQIRLWQNQETQPYQTTLDLSLHDPAMTLNIFRASLLNKEQDMLAHWPRTSSGRRVEKPGGQKQRAFAAQDAAYQAAMDSDEEGESRQSIRVAFEGKCGLCKERGHMTKECAQGWWCNTCKWVHRKGQACDNGTAKTEWKKATDERKGQFKLKAGGGGSNRG